MHKPGARRQNQSFLDHCAAERVRELLGISQADIASIRAELDGVLEAYDGDMLFESISGQPKSQKAIISKVSRQIATLEHCLASLAPEFAVEISFIPGDQYNGPKIVELDELARMLAPLRKGAFGFFSRYEPAKHRPADLPLEAAVGALLSLLQDKLHLEVRAAFKKAEAHEPTFYTPGSKVMREVLLAGHAPPRSNPMKTINHPRVEILPTSALKRNSRNARRHSKKQIGQIAPSIERFTFLVPIVVGADMVIVAGQARLEAAP